ncbi:MULTISPECIES: hypothetical protein [unclassified Streptomyces]|uniref:hypothetical protein n=1 Tax=unclassified Streptomyces TaxID=2593676 RepID=UPI002E165299|nr:MULTISPECIES: hypothetical protein [unclassified Streptomyces]WSR22202.1 hypothetical protein OG573_25770 [Streptomyces sp. NBC_01205]
MRPGQSFLAPVTLLHIAPQQLDRLVQARGRQPPTAQAPPPAHRQRAEVHPGEQHAGGGQQEGRRRCQPNRRAKKLNATDSQERDGNDGIAVERARPVHRCGCGMVDDMVAGNGDLDAPARGNGPLAHGGDVPVRGILARPPLRLP